MDASNNLQSTPKLYELLPVRVKENTLCALRKLTLYHTYYRQKNSSPITAQTSTVNTQLQGCTKMDPLDGGQF